MIPAKDEAERIAATVESVRRIDGVDLVVVVDDGSSDDTARRAEQAGAVVVRHQRNRGKAAAMETGAAAVAERDVPAPAQDGRQQPGEAGGVQEHAGDEAAQAGAGGARQPADDDGVRETSGGAQERPDGVGETSGGVQEHSDGVREQSGGGQEPAPTGARHLLFLDADLKETAVNAGPLVGPVLDGTADLAIGILPAQVRPDGSKPGGHGFVVRLARAGIEAATGYRATQPLSGQRCLTREAFEAALPLARGFGVETSMIIDLRRKGFRITEVPIELRHRASGTDLKGQLHRGRQFLHVGRALASRGALVQALRSQTRGGGR